MRHGLRRQVDGRHESVEGGRAHPATSGRGWRSRPWHWRLSNRTTIFSGTSARPWAQAASTPGRTGYRHQERHRPEVGAIAGRLPAGAGSTARPSPEDVAHSASNIYQLQPSAFRTTWAIVGWKAVGDDGPAELATVWATVLITLAVVAGFVVLLGLIARVSLGGSATVPMPTKTLGSSGSSVVVTSVSCSRDTDIAWLISYRIGIANRRRQATAGRVVLKVADASGHLVRRSTWKFSLRSSQTTTFSGQFAVSDRYKSAVCVLTVKDR